MAQEVRPARADYTVRAPVRVRDPHELKARTIRDYKRSHERIGRSLTSTQLDTLARCDLELVDAYGRAFRPPPKPVKTTRNRAQKAASAAPGLKVKTRTGPQHPDIIDTPGQFLDNKWQHAMGRVRRIMQGGSTVASRAAVTATAECPELAAELLKLHADYQQRDRFWKQNPFYGFSTTDQVRILRRKIEDICDRSTGRLGPWWVPK